MYASYVLLTMLTSAIAYFGFLNASGKVVSDDWNNVQSTLLSIFATISINVIGILLVAMVSIKAKSLQAVLEEFLVAVYNNCTISHWSSLCRTEWLCSDET